jgi:outer membrane receptor protein involved in Fe transport
VKHNLIIRILALVFILGVVTPGAFAQGTGKIAGKITDKKTGETLIGVSVKITGASKGTTSDVEGRYTLGGLATGNLTVEFSYVGYPTKKISDIAVVSGKVTNLDIVMEESGQMLEAVVITGTAKQESTSGLLIQMKNSITVSSGISSEQIRRSPDRNTSDVLKRVSGASIQDNKFVVVRGLSDRYNSARLNNAQLPSSEPDRKAFSFDIIPSSMVESIVINKTASPDLPGDFSGGVVTINTKDFPSESFLNLSLGLGYNSESTFKNFKSGPRRDYDALGFDDGSRQIPEGFPGTRQKFNSLSVEQKVDKSRLMPNSFALANNNAAPIKNYQLAWGAVKSFKNSSSFGSIISLTYRNAQNFNDAQRYDYDTPVASLDYQDDIFRYSTNVGLLANFSYKINKSKFSIKNIVNKSFEEVYTSREGTDTDGGVARQSNSIDPTDKLLVNNQFDGEHVLGRDWKLNYNLNYTFTFRDQPDLRIASYSKPISSSNDPSVPYQAEVKTTSSGSRPLSRFYSKLDEYAYGGSASLSIPFLLSKQKSTLKLGGLALLKDRKFSARILGYVPASSTFDNSIATQPIDQIFANQNIGVNGFILNEISNNNDKYTALSDVYAGYFMFDNRVDKKVRINWGARAEFYNQDLDAKGFSDEKVNADVTNFDVLPSLNLTYNATDKTNFRFSASQTVARPELRELAPFQYYDFITNSTVSGNPLLVRTKIFNADVKYEYYPESGEVFSAGLFYKKFNNPIEQIIPPGSNVNSRLRTFANASSATNYGFEIEFRKRLGFINEESVLLKNLILFSNFAYIQSKVDLSNTGAFEKDRALQGQSPYLINTGLQFNNSKNDFGASILYNRIGQRIADVGLEGYPSIYENSRDLIDIQLSKKVMANRAEIKINISDLLNQDITTYQNLNDRKAYSRSQDRSINSFNPGRTMSLSFSYNLSLKR